MDRHLSGDPVSPPDDDFHFAVRYRTEWVDGGVPWLDYSLHPASKLGLHNALLAEHDRIEVLEARGGWFDCGVFVVRHGVAEPLTEAGAERLFAALPHGNVKWIDLCRCLLPPYAGTAAGAAAPPGHAATAEQLPLWAHTHTLYDEQTEPSEQHVLDVAV
jgi:hypothetical protein